jgi:hypothetical protein
MASIALELVVCHESERAFGDSCHWFEILVLPQLMVVSQTLSEKSDEGPL